MTLRYSPNSIAVITVSLAPHVLKRRRLHLILSGRRVNSLEVASFDIAPSNSDGYMERTSSSRMIGITPLVDDTMSNKDQVTRIPPTSRNGGHSSSLLKLQADELLETLRHEYDKKAKSVENTLRRLKTIIERIEEHEQIPVRPILEIFRKDLYS